MKNLLFLVVLLVLTVSESWAQTYIAIALKSDRGELAQLQARLESQGHSVRVLKDRTKKFENDNTYVELYNPEVNTEGVRVDYRDVVIPVPDRLDHDQLMEVLLKFKAAKTMGARTLSVASEGMIHQVVLTGAGGSELDFSQLLALAKVDYVIEGGIQAPLVAEFPLYRNVRSRHHFWVGSSQTTSLSEEVGEQLGKRVMCFGEVQHHADLLRGRRIYWFAATVAPVDQNFFLALAHLRWLVRQGAVVHLITPYLPYARSDKPEFDLGVSAQGRLIADLIEGAGVDGITVVRAHAPQSLGFFRIHAHEVAGRKTIVEYLKSQNIECIVSPDAGFQKDATKYQQELSKAYLGRHVGLAVMNKQRNAEGEKILGGTGLEEIRGKRVVIIDDETSTGGTLSHVAEVIQAYEPESIFAVVTHLAGPGDKALTCPVIEKLIATDTVPSRVSHPKLQILSVAKEVADAIRAGEAQ